MAAAAKRASGVVDTGLLVSDLIAKRGAASEVVDTIRDGRLLIVVTDPLLEEYRLVLSRPRFLERFGLTTREIGQLLLLIETTARKVLPAPRVPVAVRDEKDVKVLAAALGGNVDFLISHDHDLLALRDDPAPGSLRIVTARAFLDAMA